MNARAIVTTAAGAIVALVVGVIAWRRIVAASTPAPVLPPSPASGSYYEIDGATVDLVPSVRYFGVVNITGPLSWIANEANMKAQAEKQGFTDVAVSSTRPKNWPGLVSGDYFVVGTYAGAAKTLAKMQASGRVVVADVWKEA
jgi:hypothetical protein